MIPGKTQIGSFNSMFHCELFSVAAWRLSGGNDCFDDAELFRIRPVLRPTRKYK
ncbi:MAG: hypothetical protein MEBIL_00478 [Bilophila sp.]|jgi:hypothetical protein